MFKHPQNMNSKYFGGLDNIDNIKEILNLPERDIIPSLLPSRKNVAMKRIIVGLWDIALCLLRPGVCLHVVTLFTWPDRPYWENICDLHSSLKIRLYDMQHTATYKCIINVESYLSFPCWWSVQKLYLHALLFWQSKEFFAC